jgi:TPR repeat protein
MAMLYAKGSGIAHDDFAAYVWYAVAAVQSQGGAAQARDEIAVKLSAEQIETGQKLVKRCVESGYNDCS